MYDRIQQLTREIARIAAETREGHRSGSGKVKHEKRIVRLAEIREELMALTQKSRTSPSLTLLQR